jgi:hypothetical protein
VKQNNTYSPAGKGYGPALLASGQTATFRRDSRRPPLQWTLDVAYVGNHGVGGGRTIQLGAKLSF